jgi:glycerol-3-phosphate acyltransferase PlsY
MPWLVNSTLLIFSYLCGSLPFAIWVTFWFKGSDVREYGSGHAGATNTMRQAGWLAGLLVLILDIGKGVLPTYLAHRFGFGGWVVPLTGALAVAGHCWPIWAKFRGGMGAATAAGTVLALSPLGFLMGLGVLIGLLLTIRHAARASIVTSILLAPIYYLTGLGPTVTSLALSVGVVILIRFRQDWDREYRELWLDRGSDGGEGGPSV